MKRNLLTVALTAAVALATVGAANAPTLEYTFSAPYKVGAVPAGPGSGLARPAMSISCATFASGQTPVNFLPTTPLPNTAKKG